MTRGASILWVTFSLIVGCSFNVTVHDEQKAAETALRFADTLLLKESPNGAYTQAHAAFRDAISVEELVRLVKAIEALGKPDSLVVQSYETFPGQDAMNVYIDGSASEGTVHYKVTVMGTGVAGYKVAGFWANTAPHTITGFHQEYSVKKEAKAA